MLQKEIDLDKKEESFFRSAFQKLKRIERPEKDKQKVPRDRSKLIAVTLETINPTEKEPDFRTNIRVNSKQTFCHAVMFIHFNTSSPSFGSSKAKATPKFPESSSFKASFVDWEMKYSALGVSASSLVTRTKLTDKTASNMPSVSLLIILCIQRISSMELPTSWNISYCQLFF
ncbi:hypothetical protein NRS6084_00044 [Bacillus subtilis]|nr:hypothetical protein BSP4_44080 [Bacillus subtilis subsp. subtilis]CAF1717784.1 hypothetical protein NRS6084_00044 [Bacillus subtilis]SIP92577.1 hypothetical protein SAMN05878487_0048 [Bacillus subtilis]